MKKTWACVAAAAVFAALTLPVLGQGAGTKIKVIVENSSLRVKPNMDSEVLEENVPLGTVFDQATKNGEWYEVKYQSKLGVMITGYIHEMYVEVVVTAPPVKPAVKPAVPPAAQPKPPTRPAAAMGQSRIELGLVYGLGLGTQSSETSTYDRNVPVDYVLSHEEGQGTLSYTLKSLQGLGLSFGYYFPAGFGFQLRADVNFKQDISGNGVFDMNWTWTDNTSGNLHDAFPLTGEASLIPLSFDLVYRIPTGPVFRPYLGAGLTYFIGNFKVESQAGFPFWFIYSGWQYVDYVAVPIKIDESLNSIGGNVAAGFDINVSSHLALTLGTIYFIGKEFSFDWTPATGSYRLEKHPSFTLNFLQPLANDFAKNFTSLKVKTSLFKLVAGFKIGF